MKIAKKKKNNYVSFACLESGDLFKYYNDYYIKTERTLKYTEPYANAVLIETGEYMLFDEHDYVIPINATLVIGED